MNLNTVTMLGAGVLGGAVAGGIAAAGFVNLQDTTPGATQAGHTNITGYSLAGRFGAGTSPVLARVQARETGGLQGVRSETNTGVAVFGKSTAASGLGAGGYFTTSSVGGRGIVGDALSGTGNTVGGLFYNRSTGGGVAVWGRAIGAGTATGVFGETVSSTGTALAATNAGSGNSLVAGTSTDSLRTTGVLPRHRYSAGSAAMVPLAYGFIAATSGSAFYAGSGNWTSSRSAIGQYDIDITGVTLNAGSFVVVATSFDASGNETVSQRFPSSGDVGLAVSNATTNALVNSDLQFVVFRTTGLEPGPNTPAEFENPPGFQRYGGSEEWQRADPQGFEAWRKRYVAWQMEQMKTRPYVAPTDGEPSP